MFLFQTRHVTHMNKSCHTYEWVMTHMNASCLWVEWGTSRIWTSESRDEWVIIHMRIRHVAYPNEPCHRYGVAPISRLLKLQVSVAEYSLFYRALLQKRPIILRSLLIVATLYEWIVSHIWTSHDTCECDMSLSWMSNVTHMKKWLIRWMCHNTQANDMWMRRVF